MRAPATRCLNKKRASNVEIVRTALTALDQRDVEAYLRVASPNIVGPRVLALFTLTGVGRMSGLETSIDLAGVYSFEDGKTP